MAKQGSFIQKLKQQIAQSGQSKKGFWFVKEGSKRRIRFLKGTPKDVGTDLEKGVTIPWHSKWEGQKNVVDSPCLSLYGKQCPFCDMEEVKVRERFAWSIYDYEAKEVQIFLFYANRNSPITHLATCYEEWGTIVDRDLTIARNGSGTDTTYTVMPGSPSKFRFDASPFRERKILDMVWKAFGQGDLEDYPDEGEDDTEEEDYEEEEEELEEEEDYEEEEEDYEDDDEEEELPRRSVKKVAKKATPVVAKKKVAGKRR